MQYELRPVPAIPATPRRNACRRSSPATARPWPADSRKWSTAKCRPADEFADRSTLATATPGLHRPISFRPPLPLLWARRRGRVVGHDIAFGIEVIAFKEGLRMHLLAVVVEVHHLERQRVRPDDVIAP